MSIHEGNETHTDDEAAYAEDAWRKYYDFIGEHTLRLEPRSDIIISARGWDRTVTMDFTGRNTPRNIVTWREVALALLEACDFVEEQNPTWAGVDRGLDTPFNEAKQRIDAYVIPKY